MVSYNFFVTVIKYLFSNVRYVLQLWELTASAYLPLHLCLSQLIYI
jgi:hypothetical protein